MYVAVYGHDHHRRQYGLTDMASNMAVFRHLSFFTTSYHGKHALGNCAKRAEVRRLNEFRTVLHNPIKHDGGMTRFSSSQSLRFQLILYPRRLEYHLGTTHSHKVRIWWFIIRIYIHGANSVSLSETNAWIRRRALAPCRTLNCLLIFLDPAHADLLPVEILIYVALK